MRIADLLKKAQVLHLRTEMEVFLSHLLNCERLDLIAYSEKEVPVEFLGDLQRAWVQIQQGKPVAYLTHQKEFYGLDFYVDERVLVPRDATERLVDLVVKHASQGAKVLELGTGSGAIAVAVKATRPDLQLSAGELSVEALEVAQMNANRHNADIRFYQSDLCESIPEEGFEVVVANLPYIGEESHRFIAENVEQHEPHVALFGGHDGLELYRRLLDQLSEWKPKWIFGEIGFSQGEAMRDLAKTHAPDYDFELQQDHEGLDRTFVLCYNAAHEGKTR